MVKKEREREESRKMGHSEISVFVIETSFKSLFQHTKYFYIKSSGGVKRSEQRKGQGNIKNGERTEFFLGSI
jgi:hypothetical protein